MKYIVTITTISILLFACNGTQTPIEQPQPESRTHSFKEVSLNVEEAKLAGIQTAQLETRVISSAVQASGKLDVPPNNKVSISAPMQGVVRNANVLQGSKVSKGDVLAELEHADYIQLQQDYLDYKSQQEYLKAEYSRQEELSGEQINAKKTVQQAKAAYQSMNAKMQGAKAKLQLIGIDIESLERNGIKPFISIKSPISGYVTKVNINMGSYVSPSSVLFEIVNTEHLHAELTVFEKDIMKIKIGQKVFFTLGNETKERTAEVHLLGREINNDRSVQVHCHLDVEDTYLIPGTYLKARIEVNNQRVNALPDGAIVEYEGTSYVFMETAANTYKMVEVKKGSSGGGYTEVFMPDPPSTGVKYVAKGGYSLLGKLVNTEEE